jgi:hypothetical protein
VGSERHYNSGGGGGRKQYFRFESSHALPASPSDRGEAFVNQLDSIGLSVPHRKHITSQLQTHQVNAISRFVTMMY